MAHIGLHLLSNQHKDLPLLSGTSPPPLPMHPLICPGLSSKPLEQIWRECKMCVYGKLSCAKANPCANGTRALLDCNSWHPNHCPCWLGLVGLGVEHLEGHQLPHPVINKWQGLQRNSPRSDSSVGLLLINTSAVYEHNPKNIQPALIAPCSQTQDVPMEASLPMSKAASGEWLSS